MSLFDRFLGRDRTADLAAPFESLAPQPVTGFIMPFRPLLYALQHDVLPEAMFVSRPALVATLRPDLMPEHPGLHHLVSIAATRCEGRFGWPEDVAEDDRYHAYARRLLDQMTVEHFHRPGDELWLIKMPPPVVPPEAHFVGFWNPFTESVPLPEPVRRKRYFTLERTQRRGRACVCEWTAEGSHANFGEVEVGSMEAFASLLFERVASDA